MVFEQEVNIFSQGLLNERFQSIQTQFDVTLGKISAIISDSEVEEYGSTGIRMSTKLSTVTQDINGLTAQFSDLETEYDTARGEYSSLNSRLTQIDANVDGVATSVSNVSSNLANNYSTTSSMNTAIQQSANAITTQVSRTYQTISGMSDYSTTSQVQSLIASSADAIELAVSQEYATQSALNDARNATIVSDTLHYLATSAGSGVTTATTGWTESVQTITETNKYLWTYHTYTYGDNHTSDTTPVIIGTYGEQGETGATGASAVISYITANVSGVVRDQDGSASPSSITFTNYRRVGNGNAAEYTAYWTIQELRNGSWADTSNTQGATVSQTITSTATAVRATTYSDANRTIVLDRLSVPIIAEGSDAYTVVLSNDNHTFAGDVAHALDSQTATCSVIALKGTSAIASSIGTITGMPTGMTVSISGNGTTNNSFTVSVASTLVSPNGVLTVPVTVDGKLFNMKFTYSVAFKGDTGVNSATVYLYKRSSVSVTAPTTDTTYIFNTGVLSGTLAGWTQGIPTGNDPVYMILATASSNGATDTISSNEWSTPVILAQNGANGTNGTNGTDGYNTAVINLYQRAVASPSAPVITPTYTFSTASLSAIPSGYSTSIPASNGNPCWVISATAISQSDTYVIPTSAWSTAVKLVEDGLDGTGIVEVTPIYYAHNSTTAPNAPTAEVTSTSVQGGGWTKSIPALTSTYPNMFTCDQIEYDNGIFTWTAVVRDEALKAMDTRLTAAELLITPESIVSRVTDDATAKASLIEQTASEIRLQADTIAWSSTNSSMTESGILSCTGANITGVLNNYETITVRWWEWVSSSSSMYQRTSNIKYSTIIKDSKIGLFRDDALVALFSTIPFCVKGTITNLDNVSQSFTSSWSSGSPYNQGLNISLNLKGMNIVAPNDYRNNTITETVMTIECTNPSSTSAYYAYKTTFAGAFKVSGALTASSLSVSGTKSRIVETDNYTTRKLYCYEMASPMFGDVGEGTIGDDGLCYVFVDPIFQATIYTAGYQVFLQRYGEGDCHVSERTVDYFVVSGTPGLSFGWEIKAKQGGYEFTRLDTDTEEFDTSQFSVDYGLEAIDYITELQEERRTA